MTTELELHQVTDMQLQTTCQKTLDAFVLYTNTLNAH